MLHKIENYLKEKIKINKSILITLIDPEEENTESASFIARKSEENQASAIMVGGTTLVSSSHLDDIVKTIKKTVKIPIILFPNNITGVSKFADAIWFMSLLNSSDPYFISGAQVLAAPLVKIYGLEPISLGYIIMGDGGSVGVVARASPIPYNRYKLTIAHALAAQYLGMSFVYLEAGSGVIEPIPSEMVKMVKRVIDIPLIVGGGIRTGEQAKKLAEAGSDIIVISTALEESKKVKVNTKIEEIFKGIKEGVKNR
jgi:phosphoglycerol geranylgeranyltransferase